MLPFPDEFDGAPLSAAALGGDRYVGDDRLDRRGDLRERHDRAAEMEDARVLGGGAGCCDEDTRGVGRVLQLRAPAERHAVVLAGRGGAMASVGDAVSPLSRPGP